MVILMQQRNVWLIIGACFTASIIAMIFPETFIIGGMFAILMIMVGISTYYMSTRKYPIPTEELLMARGYISH
jgi:hypothetical protein